VKGNSGTADVGCDEDVLDIFHVGSVLLFPVSNISKVKRGGGLIQAQLTHVCAFTGNGILGTTQILLSKPLCQPIIHALYEPALTVTSSC